MNTLANEIASSKSTEGDMLQTSQQPVHPERKTLTVPIPIGYRDRAPGHSELFDMINRFAEQGAKDIIMLAETWNTLLLDKRIELGDPATLKMKIHDAVYKHLLNANIR